MTTNVTEGFRCYGLGFPKATSTCDGEVRNVCYTLYMPKTGKWGDDRLLCSWCLGEARLTDRPEDMQVMTPEAWGRRFSAGRGGKRAAQAEAAGEAAAEPVVAVVSPTKRRRRRKG